MQSKAIVRKVPSENCSFVSKLTKFLSFLIYVLCNLHVTEKVCVFLFDCLVYKFALPFIELENPSKQLVYKGARPDTN